MKLLTNVIRWFVGILFIFSGLIKANDPIGLSYKMQEFFELWGMASLNSMTLAFSVLMIAFEIIAGVALILGWRFKLFSWLLLLLTIFFTFLTGYAYLSGKFKNCGCFGDCIPLTPLMSFLKDVVLTALIIFLLANRNKIRPLFGNKISAIVMILTTVLSFALQWYTLKYLPVLDCLPLKKGNNIVAQIKMPADAIPDSTVITFVYEKSGQEVEFTADKFPADFSEDTYKFIKRYDKIVRQGKNNLPALKGFTLLGSDGSEVTEPVLLKPYSVMLFIEKYENKKSWMADMEKVVNAAKAKNIPVYVITGKPDEAVSELSGSGLAALPVLALDFTALRTAARTNPTAYLIKSGFVEEKRSYACVSPLVKAIEGVPVQPQEVIPAPVIIDSTTQTGDTVQIN